MHCMLETGESALILFTSFLPISQHSVFVDSLCGVEILWVFYVFEQRCSICFKRWGYFPHTPVQLSLLRSFRNVAKSYYYCLFVCLYWTTQFALDNFHEIWHTRVLRIYGEKLQLQCKSEKNYGYWHENIKRCIGQSGARLDNLLKFFCCEWKEGMDSNGDIQHGTSFCEAVCKSHSSAQFKYRTRLFTYLFVTKFTHQVGPLIQ
jgi:hypothetical protein